MTDAAIIYRSHVEAIELLPEEEQLKAYKAIVAYCMDDTVPDDMIGKYTLAMARPLLDSWKAKRQAGQKGGKAKQTEADGSKAKQAEANRSKPKQTEADGSTGEAKVKVKVKEKVKEKDIKHVYGEYKHVHLTDDEHDKLVSEHGIDKTAQAIRFLDEYIEEKGYKSKSHYMALLRWVFDAVEEKRKSPGKNRFQNFPSRSSPEHTAMVNKIIAMQN